MKHWVFKVSDLKTLSFATHQLAKTIFQKNFKDSKWIGMTLLIHLSLSEKRLILNQERTSTWDLRTREATKITEGLRNTEPMIGNEDEQINFELNRI